MMSASFSDKFESLPELFSSDSQILNFFESIGEAFIFLNPTGKIVYLNSLAESLLKRPRRELLGQDIWQEFQEAVTTRFYEELQRARVTNRTVLFDEFYPPLDCWFAVRAVPSKAGLLVYFQNITAQKKLEQQLQELHPGFLPQQSAPKKPFPTVSMLDMDLQAVVVRRMAEGVCLIKASSNTIVYANPKFEQMFGYNPGELLGQPFSVLYSQNSESDASKTVQQVINRLYVESEFTFEVCNSRKDGSLFWTSSTASIFEHPVYETLYVIVHQDISTRKQIEAALYESEERYRLVVQALTEGIVIQDTGGRIITCNSSAEGILGLSLDQLLGRTSVDPRWRAVREDGKPFPGLEHPAMQTLLTGQPMTNVIMGIHKPSGELSWISVNTQPVFKPGPSKKEKSPIAVVSSFTDITERLKAEQAVRESEERFSRMFLAAPTPLVLTTYLDTSVLDANSQFCALIGFSTEELIGQNLFNLLKISPEIANTWKEQLHLVGNVFNHEISVYNSQNTLIWLLASLNLVEIDSRPCILSTFIDISERKRLEIALSNSEELYRVMARNLPESAVLIFDRDLRFVLAEGNALEKSGFTSEVVEGKTLWEVLQPEDAAKLLPYYEAALSGIEHHFEDYYDDRVYLVQALPLKNEKGEIFAGMFLSQDISRLKQAELRATTEKERLDVTLRSIGDGVIATDLAGNITLINSSAEKLTGWESQEASGLPIETVFNITNEKTREIVPNPVRKTLEEGKVIELSNHTVLTNKKGNAYSIADSSAPIRDRNGKIIGSVLVFRDVTERQKLAEEMIRASKLESLGVLAGGIAHDFNNLLTAIIGNLDLAQQYSRTIPAAANSENLKTSLEEVSKAVVRSKDLTLQLLTFARGGAPVKKTTQLETVVRDAANFALHGANVHCDFKLVPDLWAVEVDAGQFAQVIQNLVLNAVQAMPEGGKIEIGAGNVEIAESTHEVGLLLPAGKYVKLYIQDEGSGIEPEFLPKIFDPYFTTKQKGSGLGLAVCYAVLKKHDGLITVGSVVGKGTTFYLYLPASTRPDMVTVKQEAAIEPLIRGKGRILVMDDEASLRQLVARLLDKMGYQGEVVQNGQEAVEQYQMALQRGEPFDLVLLDMTIPGGMGGKQTLARLKEIDPSVKAIICSGYSNDPVMGNYSDYGFVGVLLKPFRAQELNKLLQKFLDQENQTQTE